MKTIAVSESHMGEHLTKSHDATHLPVRTITHLHNEKEKKKKKKEIIKTILTSKIIERNSIFAFMINIQ